MGRYFSGDIEGKFWFGVQASNDADFFGSIGTAPNYFDYYFDRDNLIDIDKGINECIEKLGKYKEILDDFFEKNNGYNDEDLAKELIITTEEVNNLLEWYARLELGIKIKNCVIENGSCSFQAEC